MSDSVISDLVGAGQPALEVVKTEESAPEKPTEAPEETPQEAAKAVDKILNALLGMIEPGIGSKTNFKLMIYGDPGTTKTSLSATAPNNLIFDFEQGLISAATSPHGIAKNVRPIKYKNFRQARGLVDKLAERPQELEWIDVFTIDTLSDLSARSLAEICKEDYEAGLITSPYLPETEQYTKNNEKMDQYVRSLKDLDRDLIILCHARTSEPKGQAAKTYPDFSEKLANKLEAKMDVVGYMTKEQIDGNIVPVMTTSHPGGIHCKSRIDLPAQIINPTWPQLKAAWQRTMDKLDA